MGILLPLHKDRNGITMDELVKQASDLIRQGALSQGRWKVTEVPDVRTIRYYLSTGVLPKPLEYRGTAAVFGYRHLLILLAIKTLQARFLPLKQIGEILGPLDEKALEEVIQRGAPADAAGLVFPGDGGETPLRVPTRTRKSRGRSADSASLAPEQLPALPGMEQLVKPATFERIEVEPGLELQVRSDYVGPTAPSGANALLSKIRVLLSARQQRKAELVATEEEAGESPKK